MLNEDMLRKYSRIKSESLSKISTVIAKIVFLGDCFYRCTL